MRVLRQPLKMVDYQVVNLSAPGSICSVAYRTMEPAGELPPAERRIDMWYFATDESPAPVPYRVWIVGTGDDFPDGIPFIGTVITFRGFVFHVFAGPING